MSNSQKRMNKVRPRVPLSKAEVQALIDYHFRMANHYGNIRNSGAITQRQFHQNKAKEYITLRDNYQYLRTV